MAVAGALCGIAGLLLSGFAFQRSRSAVDDCRAVVQRLVPDSGGIDVRAVRDVAVVRYDALEEMSGARSFSMALLSSAGDGVVLTSINGRTESRTYAKSVAGGESAEVLSPEEYRAIRAARLGQGPSGAPVSGPGRSAAGPLVPPVRAADPEAEAPDEAARQVSVVPAQGEPAERAEPSEPAAADTEDADGGAPAEAGRGAGRRRASSKAAKG
ncbi:uncharacterized protein DUF4446 [Murinocardiopsis flavida]|uniref:Uncharacterized protein DUF4446 n=2 Tax=Murinocardiopsis flavida TaxID=645275 RepID=A0A2P8DQ46_9ACTN|nr:uncharacterized protein DUF4446 [Murinocardiopsis flavida]